jgi:hypothetical protein
MAWTATVRVLETEVERLRESLRLIAEYDGTAANADMVHIARDALAGKRA